MATPINTKNMFEANNAVPSVTENGAGKTSIKPVANQAKTNGAFQETPRGTNQGKTVEEVCESCGSNSLHALRLGYSFIDWICDICGKTAEKPLANRQ